MQSFLEFLCSCASSKKRYAQSKAMPGDTVMSAVCLLHTVRDNLGPAGGECLDGGEVQDWEKQMVLPKAALLKALCSRGRIPLLRSMAPSFSSCKASVM